MTILNRARSPLLPDLERSRAVLIACDDPAVRVPESQPTVRTKELAGALVAPHLGPAFSARHLTLVTSWTSPQELVDVVGPPLAEASDVVLFHYRGTGAVHRRLLDPTLLEIGRLVRESAATRHVVLLDCEDNAHILRSCRRDLAPGDRRTDSIAMHGVLPVVEGHEPDSRGDEFTDTLVDVLHSGVRGRRAVLSLLDLCDAVENEWIAGASSVSVSDEHQAALSINLAHGPAAVRKGT